MKKVKRYNENGYVTSDDSNSGMKEKYNADQLADNFDDYGSKRGAGAAGTSESTTEEAGGAMLKSMRDAATKPKMVKPKTTVKATSEKPESSGVTRMSKEAGEAAQAKFRESSKPDVTKMSLSERMKASRESARSGSGKTDTRSVSERLRSAFGMAKGGSASSRADGIATKGKTRGKMC
jgi:hypothetical protein